MEKRLSMSYSEEKRGNEIVRSYYTKSENNFHVLSQVIKIEKGESSAMVSVDGKVISGYQGEANNVSKLFFDGENIVTFVVKKESITALKMKLSEVLTKSIPAREIKRIYAVATENAAEEILASKSGFFKIPLLDGMAIFNSKKIKFAKCSLEKIDDQNIEFHNLENLVKEIAKDQKVTKGENPGYSKELSEIKAT